MYTHKSWVDIKDPELRQKILSSLTNQQLLEFATRESQLAERAIVQAKFWYAAPYAVLKEAFHAR